MKTQCPHCNSKFKTADKAVGKEAKCPKCKQRFKIVPVVEVEEPTYPQSPEKQIPARLPNETVDNKKRNQKALNITIAAGIALGVLIAIFLTPAPDELHNRFSDRLAEWLVAFITTNITVKVVLLIVNIPVYFLLAGLIFGNLKHFWRSEKYKYIPTFYILLSRKGRNMFRRDYYPEGHFSWKLILMRSLHGFLFVAVYLVQYMLIKIIFLSG